METGSNNSFLTIQPSVVVSADKAETEPISSDRTVLQIGRSGVIQSNFTKDLLQLIDFKTYDFAYCLTNEDWANQVGRVLENLNLLSPLYLVEPSGFVLIPNSLYRASDMENHFKSTGLEANEKTVSEYQIEGAEYRLISKIPSELDNVLNGGRSISDLCPVLESQSDSKKARLLVQVRDEQIDVILSEKTIVLVNRFNANHENDMLYFCVAAIEQAGLNIDDILVSVTGKRDKLELVSELLSRYFKNLRNLSIPKKLKVPYGFKDVDPAICWTTLNAHLCV